jgi:hypothetical protein
VSVKPGSLDFPAMLTKGSTAGQFCKCFNETLY